MTSIAELRMRQRIARSEPELELVEYVRQWLLRELVASYGYSLEWIGSRILSGHVLPEESNRDDFADISILTQWNHPFILIVACRQRADVDPEQRLRNGLLAMPDTAMGMSTDGTEERTRVVRKRFEASKFDYILDIDAYSGRGLPSPRCVVRLDSVDALPRTHRSPAGQPMVPLNERFENVFFEAHSHIRDIDGMHAGEALDELCKVVYAKLYDEAHPDSQGRPRMQAWIYGCTEEFAASVRHVYREATEHDARVFRRKVPDYDRSPGVFGSGMRLSSPALAKVVETLQEYDLGRSGTDVKGRAFQKVVGPAIRAGMGQYFTPDPVIRFAVAVTDPRVDDWILDPFCGSGHFLGAALQHVRDKARGHSGKILHDFAFGRLHGIEKSEQMVRIAMADMWLRGNGHSNIRCTDALLAFENYLDLKPESFDLILTNPPFGSILGQEALRLLAPFTLAKQRGAAPVEVLGLERCIQFLRPGGRLGIVLPDGVLANRNTRYVRDWLEVQAKVRGIVSLPIETFQPFGAAIKTSILFARKWKHGESRDSDYPVFIARVDNVGYDSTGRSRAGSELDQVADAFLRFLALEGW